MDSERYSDFNALRTERDRPFDRPHELKRESLFHKDIMDGLGNISKKLEEVDGNIGKRLQEFLTSFASAKAEEPKKIEVPSAAELQVQSGGSLEQITADEVNKLLSDVQALHKEVTESEQNTGDGASSGAGVQSGGGCNCETDFEGKFNAMQCEIDSLKKDVNSMTENMMHLLTYFNARSSKTPMKLKAGMDGGHITFRAEPK